MNLPHALSILLCSICLLSLVAGPLNAANPAAVSGMVSLNGMPVAKGTISLHFENGEFVGAPVKDGKYAFERITVPQGMYKVTISGEGLPATYGDAERTPLKFDVRDAHNQFNLDLVK